MHPINSLTPDERSSLLRTLLQKHPGLQQEAAAVAATILDAVDSDQVAAEVEDAIRSCDPHELYSRAGGTAHGYVEPSEAACDMLDEAIEPLIGDLRRRLDQGRSAAAPTRSPTASSPRRRSGWRCSSGPWPARCRPRGERDDHDRIHPRTFRAAPRVIMAKMV